MKALRLGALALTIMGTAAMADVPSPSKFVEKAGASDMFEIESARLVVTSKNPAIRSFATQMITDHTKSTKMVKTAARADHVAVGRPSLNVKQRADLTALKVASGKMKDDLYVKQQKASHADALQLMQDYADGGSARHLKMTAAKITPVVEKHASMLSSM